jgi:hypothetical protein
MGWQGLGEAPQVSERIAALLPALDLGPRAQALVLPEAVKLAQAQLSAIMVACPMLLLPQMRVHIEHSSVHRGNVTLAKAIAMSSHSRFPMLPDGIPAEQMRAFVSRPATHAGSTQPRQRARATWKGFQSARRQAPSLCRLPLPNVKAKWRGAGPLLAQCTAAAENWSQVPIDISQNLSIWHKNR